MIFAIIKEGVGMIEDILVILMMAFGLFAILMFILFYVYLKKRYNKKHLSDDYTKDVNYDKEEKDNDNKKKNNYEEFIPKKKK